METSLESRLQKRKSLEERMRIALSVLLILLFCMLLNSLHVSEKSLDMESIMVVSAFSILLMVLIGKMGITISERLVLLLGYIFRLGYLYLNIYMGVSISDSDSFLFWGRDVAIYSGRREAEDISYESILAKTMNIVGENRVLLQYFNIVVWSLVVLLFTYCLGLLKINNNIRIIGFIGLAFLPQYLILSSALMRESMITFFNMASFCFFLKWFRTGRFKDIILAEIMVLLSMILHSGAIGLGIAYGIAYAFFDKKSRKIRISLKTIAICVVGVFLIFLMLLSPYKNLATTYIPKIENIFELQSRFWETGGSDYLRNLPYTENIFIFIGYTLIRLVYFYISPVPWEWRGMIDMLAFVVDAIVPILTFLLGLSTWKKDKENRILIGFTLFCLFVMGIVFAWGVSNAGTAIRHRNKLIGIELMLLCFCINSRLNIWRKAGRSFIYDEVGGAD